MAQLVEHDLHRVLSQVPTDIRAMMRKDNIWLAGGFIRAAISGEEPNDYDLWGMDKTELQIAAINLAASYGGKMHQTDNAFTVIAPPRLPAQFITRWMTDTPEEMARSFDFTIVQAVVWCEASNHLNQYKGYWRSWCADTFYQDLAAKRLVYTAPERAEDLGGSMLRVLKYVYRGYHIKPAMLASVIQRLLKGIEQDATFFISPTAQHAVLTKLLVEVDPLVVIDGLEIHHEPHDEISF